MATVCDSVSTVQVNTAAPLASVVSLVVTVAV
jgi:hypothetical protein